jgi:hypothetical protein
MKSIYIITHRNHELLKFLNDYDNYVQGAMGEITWYYSLIHSLDKIGIKKENIHITNRILNTNISDNSIFFMDFLTIPANSNLIIEQNIIDKVFCLCFFGRTTKTGHSSIEELKIDLPYNQVITPWNYNINNTFLGFNINVLYKDIQSNNKYENIGVLYGKHLNLLNIDLIKFLTSKNMKFYCVSKDPLELDNIYNLGNLSPNEWRQLLCQCKFLLGFGHPRVGPTILEAMYYKIPVVTQLSQISNTGIEKTKNFYNTDKLTYNEVYQVLIDIMWYDGDDTNLFEHNEIPYLDRLKNIIK